MTGARGGARTARRWCRPPPGRRCAPWRRAPFNLLDGIVALANRDYLSEDVLFSDLSGWGWFFVVFGALQLLIGIAVLMGSQVALWPGVVVAGINAVAQLAYARSNPDPAWSIAIVALDVVVIYGFMSRGLEVGVETVDDA